MKLKLILAAFFFFLSICSVSTCKKSIETVSGEALLAIDVEWYFDNDLIKVELDGSVLLEDRVTTNWSISAACFIPRKNYSFGVHVVKFILPEKGLQRSHFFNLKNTLTILIRYDREENKISFSEYNGLIFRD